MGYKYLPLSILFHGFPLQFQVTRKFSTSSHELASVHVTIVIRLDQANNIMYITETIAVADIHYKVGAIFQLWT